MNINNNNSLATWEKPTELYFRVLGLIMPFLLSHRGCYNPSLLQAPISHNFILRVLSLNAVSPDETLHVTGKAGEERLDWFSRGSALPVRGVLCLRCCGSLLLLVCWHFLLSHHRPCPWWLQNLSSRLRSSGAALGLETVSYSGKGETCKDLLQSRKSTPPMLPDFWIKNTLPPREQFRFIL